MKNLSLVLVALLVVTFTHACSGSADQAETVDTTVTETTVDSTWTEDAAADSTVSDSTEVEVPAGN